MKHIWTLYIRNFERILCLTENDALAIRAEFLNLNPDPDAKIDMPVKVELETHETFFSIGKVS